MKSVAIFYASKSGNTKIVADLLSDGFDGAKQYNLQVTHCEFMNDYDNIILGVATYDDGNLQDAWKDIWDEFRHIDFTNKNVAIFGLGNQEKFPNHFCDAMGLVYNQIKGKGANVVGFTSTDGYSFEDSNAILSDDKFVGLLIDVENQNDLTEKRVEDWIETLKKEFP